MAQARLIELQQLLAELNYLPLSFTPSAPVKTRRRPPWRNRERVRLALAKYSDVAHLPVERRLRERHRLGGAVMNFENQNGLAVDGLAGTRVWSALLSDVESGKMDADPYTYVFVTKQLPESLTLFSNGTPALFDIPVNTGAPGADTTDGTYPVFEHVTTTDGGETNPDGSTYDDPDVPWASFFKRG